MTASNITTRASIKNQPYPNTKMWLRITAVIHIPVNRAPNLAVFGIRSRTAITVSNTPDPSYGRWRIALGSGVCGAEFGGQQALSLYLLVSSPRWLAHGSDAEAGRRTV